MVKIFKANLLLERARKVLEKSGVRDYIISSKAKKDLEIKCRNLRQAEVSPTEVYQSASLLAGEKGYGKNSVGFDGKKIYLPSEVVEALKEDLGISSPQQV